MTSARFWWIQVPGWLLFVYLVYAQGIPAIDYDLGIAMGTQEPAEVITPVGVAFWFGFAFADLVVYIPMLGMGLAGHWKGASWAPYVLGGALGITVYWPVVVLSAAFDASDAPGWLLDTTMFWWVLPVIAVWALWAIFACTANDRPAETAQ